MTLLTLLIIQNNADVYADVGGPCTEKGKYHGKYTGWIMLNEDRWSPVLNTEPVYDTAKEAKNVMLKLIEYVKNIDLPGMGELLPPEVGETINDIIFAAKNKTIGELK